MDFIRLASRFKPAVHFIHSLIRFTADDVNSILIPNTVCGICLGLAGTPFPSPCSPLEILIRAPVVFFWVWANLLHFNVSNQIQASSIEEDRRNKPWRPLPAGIISLTQAKRFHMFWPPIVSLISIWAGGLEATVSLQILTLAYNELNLGDHWISRHLLNAGGYMSFILGSIQVAVYPHQMQGSELSWRWGGVIAAAVCTGIHAMDLYDCLGDAKRGRNTLPIALGDAWARRVLIVSTSVVSFCASPVMGVTPVSAIPTILLGGVVCLRNIGNYRGRNFDKATFKIWCFWIMSLFMMPCGAILWETGRLVVV